MNAVDTAKRVFELIEAKDTAGAAKLLTDDFTFSGPTPEPIGGAQWLAMHDKLNAAFPDWKFNLTDVHEHGDFIHSTAQITGTHTGDLDLSPMGMPTIPATGKAVKLPREELNVKVVGDKIKSIDGPPVEGGGLMGILGQLGVQPPKM